MKKLLQWMSAALFAGVLLAGAVERPNVLWITCEDISPYLGCYGDELAQTPHLDRLAKEGIRFTHAYANSPVCGIARSCLLTGMHASTIGTQNMRARTQLPPEIPAYPALFRKAGYYCTNNYKQDYNSNFEYDKSLWDESSHDAHWKNRPEGKPFFAVFNIEYSHEGQITDARRAFYLSKGMIPETPRVKPEDVKLPAYMPDLPEMREDWTRLYDQLTMVDNRFAGRLNELKKAGLMEDTIVVFYSDHGGHLARSKRYIYNGGTQVPLIIRFPEKWQHLAPGNPGTVCDDLVQFIDIPKTFLSICGIEPPEIMQGRVFTGPGREPPLDTIHFTRDRQITRFDCSRAVTDGRYYYIRNFMPHRPRGRDNRYGYMVQGNWRAWEAWYDGNPEAAGPVYSQFFKPKPSTELHDLTTDPDEICNLVGEPKTQEVEKRLSDNLDRWMVETRDSGLIPEPLVYELLNETYPTIYDYAQSDEYPIELILSVAKKASAPKPNSHVQEYLEMTEYANPIVRWWGEYGLFRARDGGAKIQKALRKIIEDDSYAANRIMAAQALGMCGDSDLAFQTIMNELKKTNKSYVFLFGLNALQYSHTDNRLTKEDWQKLKELSHPHGENRGDTYGYNYANRLIDDAVSLWPKRRIVD